MQPKYNKQRQSGVLVTHWSQST